MDSVIDTRCKVPWLHLVATVTALHWRTTPPMRGGELDFDSQSSPHPRRACTLVPRSHSQISLSGCLHHFWVPISRPRTHCTSGRRPRACCGNRLRRLHAQTPNVHNPIKLFALQAPRCWCLLTTQRCCTPSSQPAAMPNAESAICSQIVPALHTTRRAAGVCTPHGGARCHPGCLLRGIKRSRSILIELLFRVQTGRHPGRLLQRRRGIKFNRKIQTLQKF